MAIIFSLINNFHDLFWTGHKSLTRSLQKVQLNLKYWNSSVQSWWYLYRTLLIPSLKGIYNHDSLPSPLVDKLFVLITCLLVECYVLVDWLGGLANKYLAPDQGNGIPKEFRGGEGRGHSCTMTKSQLFCHQGWPNLVNKWFIIWSVDDHVWTNNTRN